MFAWLNKQGIKTSEGHIFQRMHRFYYHYIEGDHTMQIYVEPCTDEHGRYTETINLQSLEHWLPPFENEPIPAQRKHEIRERIAAALAFMDIEHIFE